MFPQDVMEAAARVLELARSAGVTLVTVESASGGLAAGALTAPPGASDVFAGGLVTFSNRSKIEAVGVSPTLIEVYGGVSDIVAVAMAEGGLKVLCGGATAAGISVANTGIAGPNGALAGWPADLARLQMPMKPRPVGLVHFAVARTGLPTLHHEARFGDLGRAAVRLEATRTTLALLERALQA